MEIPATDLDSDTGMDTLLEKLDSVFLKEEKYRAYERIPILTALQ